MLRILEIRSSGRFLYGALIFIVALMPFSLAGQSKKIDSLKQLIVSMPDDTSKINRLDVLSDNYNILGMDDSVVSISEKSLELAKKIDYKEGIAKLLYNIAWGRFNLGNHEESLAPAQESYQIYVALGMMEEAAWHNEILFSYQRHIGDLDSALHLAKSMYQTFENLGSKKGMAYSLLSIADVEILKSNDNNALEALLQSLELFEAINNKWGISNVYNLLGEFYRLNEEYPLAIKYFRMQFNLLNTSESEFDAVGVYTGLGNVYMAIKNYDSAEYFFLKSLELDKKVNYLYGMGIDYNNLAEIYAQTKRNEEALFNYQQSLQLCETIGDVEGSIYPLEGMGVIFTRLGKYSKATQFMQRARQIEEKLSLQRMLVGNYFYQATLDSAKGNYDQAYAWLKKRILLSDSLYNKDKLSTTIELQTRFDSEKKDQRIKFLNEEKELVSQQQANEKIFWLILLASLAILILALTYIVVYKMKTGRILSLKNSQIAEKNEELYLGNETLKKLTGELEVKNKDLAMKNEKLEDLNREKDGLIGIVAHDLRGPISKTLGLANLLRNSVQMSKQQEEVIGLIEKVCKDGNSLIKDLLEINRIETVEDEYLSLVNIESLMNNSRREFGPIADRKNISLSIIGPGEGIEMMTEARALTRILDNLVSNAIKFSEANKSVLVHYSMPDDKLVISVTDQGPGILEEEKIHLYKKFKKLSAKPTGGESSTGLGLSIAKMLTEKLGGKISVESKVGTGSTFTVILPYVKGNQRDRHTAMTKTEWAD